MSDFRGRLSESEAAEYALLGNARLTLVRKATGNRFTYRIAACKKVKDGEDSRHYVGVLTGPDNESSYTFLGTIFAGATYRHGKKSPITTDAPSAKAWEWFWRNRADAAKLDEGVEIW